MQLSLLRKSSVRAGLVAILPLTMLAGCFALEGAPNGLIEVRSSGDGFEIAVCRDLNVDQIFVQYSQGASEPILANGSWTRVVGAGDVFTSQQGSPNSLPLGDPSPLPEPEGWLVIYLSSSSTSSPASAEGDFVIPSTGLPRDGWLRQDGSVGEQACTD